MTALRGMPGPGPRRPASVAYSPVAVPLTIRAICAAVVG